MRSSRCGASAPDSGQHDAAQRFANSLHDLDGALPSEHQQAGGDASHELRHLVQPLCLGGRAQGLSDSLLDTRHVDDAFA